MTFPIKLPLGRSRSLECDGEPGVCAQSSGHTDHSLIPGSLWIIDTQHTIFYLFTYGRRSFRTWLIKHLSKAREESLILWLPWFLLGFAMVPRTYMLSICTSFSVLAFFQAFFPQKLVPLIHPVLQEGKQGILWCFITLVSRPWSSHGNNFSLVSLNPFYSCHPTSKLPIAPQVQLQSLPVSSFPIAELHSKHLPHMLSQQYWKMTDTVTKLSTLKMYPSSVCDW